MDQVINFLYVLFNGDFFVVIIVALILILGVVLVGLIKTQKEYEKLLEEKNNKENVVIETSNEQVEKFETPINNIEVNKEVKEEKIDSTEPILEIEDKKEINPIEAYELDEEKNAVISTKELENIEKERNELYGVENNAKLIEEYETEQENKAIISYSELLKNANSLELEYIEKPKEEENAPVIKQVDVKKSFKGVTYAAEEEYLKILKELRNNLNLNG